MTDSQSIDGSGSDSDDDVAKLIAQNKLKCDSKRPREDEDEDDSDDEDDDDESDDSSVVEPENITAVSYKLKQLEHQRRIRQRSNLLRRANDSDDDDDDDDEPAVSAMAPVPMMVDPNKIHVEVKVSAEGEVMEILSSDEDEDDRKQAPSSSLCRDNKELLAIQAACQRLKASNQTSAGADKIECSVDDDDDHRHHHHHRSIAVEEWTLDVHCKLMEHSAVQSTRAVSLHVWNTTTLSQLQEEILTACGLNNQSAVVSTLMLDGKLLCKSSSSAKQAKSLKAASPNIKSGSVLKATLHLTGLQMSAKQTLQDREEKEQAKWGKQITVSLRRIVDRKEHREDWHIRESEPFSNLTAKYCEKHSLKINLKFDGANIDADKTPKDYDMEDEDLIDVAEIQ
jgi:hypothetical protein